MYCIRPDPLRASKRVWLRETSRTAAIIFLYIYLFIYLYIYIYIRVVRRALNLLRASFSPIFQYFSAVNVTRVSFSLILDISIFPNLYALCHGAMDSSA